MPSKTRRFADQDLAALKEAAPIAEVIGATVSLTPSGDDLIGSCPFHEDDRPSFHVTPAKGVFHCFGCSAAGDVINFVQRSRGLDFPAAVNALADEFGVRISAESDAAASERAEYHDVLSRAAKFFARALQEAPADSPVHKFMASRGIGEEAVKTFQLGLAPADASAGLIHAAQAAGISRDQLIGASLARTSGNELHDYFNDRLMFPICDARGAIVGFGGRTLGNSKAKYLNSAQTPFFAKGRVLYGVTPGKPLAPKYEHIIVPEGYTDALAINSSTSHMALSPMGTALTKAHASQLARITDLVYVCFDGDTSGAATALAASRRLLEHRSVEIRMVELPAGSDPASLIAKGGADAFEECLARHEPPFVFAVRHAINTADLETARGRDHLVDALAPLFAAAPAGPLRHAQLELAAAAAEIPLDEMRTALIERS